MPTSRAWCIATSSRRTSCRPDGAPVVMDFGLAKRDAGEITMTIDGQILARPVGPIEKAWRWCRRKPAAAGLVTALVLLVIVGSGATIWYQGHVARQERDALVRQAEVDRQHALTEHGVRQALEQGDKIRAELQVI